MLRCHDNEQLRNALGLRLDFVGPHWAGSGPDGTPYVRKPHIGDIDPELMTSTAKKSSDDPESDADMSDGEVCVLLQATEKSVRGFLALARREAEAGWSVHSSNNLRDWLICDIQGFGARPQACK